LGTQCAQTGVFQVICGTQRGANQSVCEHDNLCAWNPATSTCNVNGAFFGTLRLILNVVCVQNTHRRSTVFLPSLIS